MAENTTYTVEQIEQALLDNADFEEANSVTKAKAFITAGKRWLILRPASASSQGNSLSLNAGQVQSMVTRAQEFIAANDTSGTSRVRFLGMDGFSR